MPTYYQRAGLRAIEQAATRGVVLPDNIQVDVYGDETLSSDERDHDVTIRTAYNFFLTNDDGRYSSGMRRRITDSEIAPTIVKVHSPENYDEDTEVKSGGPQAYLAVWPGDEGRTLLCVNRNARRLGFGTVAMLAATAVAGGLLAWIHQNNTGARDFLMGFGMTQQRTNRSGGVAYQVYNSSEDGMEDDPYDIQEPVDVGDIVPPDLSELYWSIEPTELPVEERRAYTALELSHSTISRAEYALEEFLPGDLGASTIDIARRGILTANNDEAELMWRRRIAYLQSDPSRTGQDSLYTEMCGTEECSECRRYGTEQEGF